MRPLLPILLAATLTVHPLPAAASPLCDAYAGLPGTEPEAGMVALPGGSFIMGADDGWPEEGAAHRVSVGPFRIDRTEVTNAQFARFAAATGYVTLAERGPAPGALVFSPPATVRDMEDLSQWWRFVPGASWRHPEGPASSIAGRENHPVVQVAYEDALAYARWLGHDLPTEAEWEYAARGGLDGTDGAYTPEGGWQANTWQGPFPVRDDAADGYPGIAPVGCFPANGYGLLDMLGNVWEYARDWYAPGHPAAPATNPTGPGLMEVAARPVAGQQPATVIKGGSWLCTPDFCARYRPPARQPQELGMGTSHVGFRTVLRVAS